jgi:hypothetical protein
MDQYSKTHKVIQVIHIINTKFVLPVDEIVNYWSESNVIVPQALYIIKVK